MVYLNLITIIIFIQVLVFVKLNQLTGNNAAKKFDYFQLKYNRHYKNEEDKNNGFKNFLRTLNEVEDLNKRYINDTTMYVINKYADADPNYIDERYGIQLTPYDNVRDPNKAVRSQHETENKNTKFIEDAHLYDLDKAEELYELYKKKYNKQNATKKRERIARYYRFVKTLVEINKKNMEDDTEPIKLDDKADEIKEPNEYFY